MDYANTAKVEFIVDPKVLFHGWWIYSYLHIRWSSDCQGGVQIGSLKTLWPDHNACIDDTECLGRKTAFWLINMRWTVKNFALSLNDRDDEVQPRPQGFSLQKWVGRFFKGKALGTRLDEVKDSRKNINCFVPRVSQASWSAVSEHFPRRLIQGHFNLKNTTVLSDCQKMLLPNTNSLFFQ